MKTSHNIDDFQLPSLDRLKWGTTGSSSEPVVVPVANIASQGCQIDVSSNISTASSSIAGMDLNDSELTIVIGSFGSTSDNDFVLANSAWYSNPADAGAYMVGWRYNAGTMTIRVTKAGVTTTSAVAGTWTHKYLRLTHSSVTNRVDWYAGSSRDGSDQRRYTPAAFVSGNNNLFTAANIESLALKISRGATAGTKLIINNVNAVNTTISRTGGNPQGYFYDDFNSWPFEGATALFAVVDRGFGPYYLADMTGSSQAQLLRPGGGWTNAYLRLNAQSSDTDDITIRTNLISTIKNVDITARISVADDNASSLPVRGAAIMWRTDEGCSDKYQLTISQDELKVSVFLDGSSEVAVLKRYAAVTSLGSFYTYRIVHADNEIVVYRDGGPGSEDEGNPTELFRTEDNNEYISVGGHVGFYALGCMVDIDELAIQPGYSQLSQISPAPIMRNRKMGIHMVSGSRFETQTSMSTDPNIITSMEDLIGKKFSSTYHYTAYSDSVDSGVIALATTIARARKSNFISWNAFNSTRLSAIASGSADSVIDAMIAAVATIPGDVYVAPLPWSNQVMPWSPLDFVVNGTITSVTSTTVIVDSAKNWTTNEFAGRTVRVNTPHGVQWKTISSNTATALTLSSGLDPLPSTTNAYYIQSSTSGGTETDYVNAFRRIVDRFRNQNSSAKIVFTGNGIADQRSGTALLEHWFPGFDYVDHYMLRAVNTGTNANESWNYLREILDTTNIYDRIEACAEGNIVGKASAHRVNLCINPSFEVDTTGWTAQGNCSIARTTSWFNAGVASLAITTSAAGTSLAGTPTGLSGYACKPGQVFTGSAYFRSAAVSRTIGMIANFYDAAGAFISSTAGATTASSISATIGRHVTFTVPATAAFFNVQASVVALAGSEVHYFDSVLVEEASSAGAWFDGTVSGYAWTGTAHASTSQETRTNVRVESVGTEDLTDKTITVFFTTGPETRVIRSNTSTVVETGSNAFSVLIPKGTLYVIDSRNQEVPKQISLIAGSAETHYRFNSFESGLATQPITVENSGVPDGDAFDAITSTGIVYEGSPSLVRNGRSSAKLNAAANSKTLTWLMPSVSTGIKTVGISTYYYRPSLSGATDQNFIDLGDDDLGRCARLTITTAGELQIRDSADQVQATTPLVLPGDVFPTAEWVRLEVLVACDPDIISGNFIRVKIYNSSISDILGSEIHSLTWTSANLITVATNSSFETTVGNWLNHTNTTIARSTLHAKEGIASLELTATAGGGLFSFMNPAVNTVSVVPGQTIKASAWFKAGATARSCFLELYFQTSGGITLGSFGTGDIVTDSTTDWTQATVTHVAPATAAKVYVMLRVNSVNASEKHYVDVVEIANVISAPKSVQFMHETAGGGSTVYYDDPTVSVDTEIEKRSKALWLYDLLSTVDFPRITNVILHSVDYSTETVLGYAGGYVGNLNFDTRLDSSPKSIASVQNVLGSQGGVHLYLRPQVVPVGYEPSASVGQLEYMKLIESGFQDLTIVPTMGGLLLQDFDFGSPTPRAAVEIRPTNDGSRDYTEHLSTKGVSLDFICYSDENAQGHYYRELLATWQRPNRRPQLVYKLKGDPIERMIRLRPESMARPWTVETTRTGKLNMGIQFIAYDGKEFSTLEQRATIFGGDPTTPVNTAGSARTYPRIRIWGLNGSGENALIVNSSTEAIKGVGLARIGLNFKIEDDSFIEINMAERTIQWMGLPGPAFSLLRYLTSREWWCLEPYYNDISFQIDDDNGFAEIFWHDSHL